MKTFRIYGTISSQILANQKYNLGNVGGIYLPYENITERVVYTNQGNIGVINYTATGDLEFTPITVPETTGQIMYIYMPYY